MGTCKDLGGTLATLDSPSRNAFVIGNLALITGEKNHSKVLPEATTETFDNPTFLSSIE